MPTYLIVQNSQPRMRKPTRMLLTYILFVVFMAMYWFGFFYVGTSDWQEIERSQIEGR